jgi:hypothetical protein
MAHEKLKINHKAQNKIWTNPQIKNHNRSHELTLIRPQTHHKHPEHMFLKIPNTICGENCECSSWVQEVYKPGNINVLFSQCGS